MLIFLASLTSTAHARTLTLHSQGMNIQAGGPTSMIPKGLQPCSAPPRTTGALTLMTLTLSMTGNSSSSSRVVLTGAQHPIFKMTRIFRTGGVLEAGMPRRECSRSSRDGAQETMGARASQGMKMMIECPAEGRLCSMEGKLPDATGSRYACTQRATQSLMSSMVRLWGAALFHSAAQ